jgi:hypothetical protein
LPRLVHHQRLARGDDARRQTGTEVHVVGRDHLIVFAVVRESDTPRLAVVQRDVDDVGVESGAHLLANEVDESDQVELRPGGLAHLIDDLQLRGALTSLVDEPRVLERDAQAGGQRVEQAHVALGERMSPFEVLE